jgi:hypothetical protein
MTQVDQFFMSPPDQFLMSFDTQNNGITRATLS